MPGTDAGKATNEEHAMRPRFDPTINLGHVITATMTLVAIGGAWATFKSDVAALAKADDRHEKQIEAKADRETVSRAELELSRRIVETQQNLTTTTVSINEGFREVKGLLRDLDQKLDRKADKTGR